MRVKSKLFKFMKLWRIIQDNNIVEGFTSEKDTDSYIKFQEGNWVKEEYEGTKFDGSKEEFLQFFGISKQKISDTDLRDYLESTICNSYYKAEPIVADGKEYDCYGYYTLSYYCDQWWACGLNKSKKINEEYYLEEIARGEGDSSLDALCSLFIVKHDLFLNKEDMIQFKANLGTSI